MVVKRVFSSLTYSDILTDFDRSKKIDTETDISVSIIGQVTKTSEVLISSRSDHLDRKNSKKNKK